MMKSRSEARTMLNVELKENDLQLIDIPCVILAGGKSSRMGKDKSLLTFPNSKFMKSRRNEDNIQNSTLIEYQYIRLSKIFKDVYISAKSNKFDFLKRNEKERLILEDDKIFSPMVALSSIFSKLKNDKIFIITVDTPFVSKESIIKIIDNSKGYDIAVAKTAKIHNLCGCFSKKLQDDIAELLSKNIHKINQLIKTNYTNCVEFEKDDEFLNLNTFEDYEKAKHYISKTNDSH